MRRKLLSVVLCVCMMMTMAPFAFAAGEDIGTPESVVAKIGDQEYVTLQAAINAATTGQTIQLVADTTDTTSDSYIIQDGKELNLDLNGKHLTLPEIISSYFIIKNGKLTITDTSAEGNGEIVATKCDNLIDIQGSNTTFDFEKGTITLNGYWSYEGIKYGNTAVLIRLDTESTDATGTPSVNFGKDAKIVIANKSGEDTIYPGWAIMVNGIASGKTAHYGATVDVYGQIINGGLYVNGTVVATQNTVPVFNVYDGAKIDGQIYAAGYAKWNISGGDIKADTGMEIRAGELNMTGGSLVGTATPTSVKPNGNGGTSDGVGLAIAQHTTRLPISVNISSGTISGFTGLLESNPQNSSSADIEKINVNISGGNFTASNGGTNAAFSDDNRLTITGGTFSSDVSAYVADGYIQTESGTVEALGESNAVAKIGTTYYKTLADAVAAVQDGSTITLLKDTTGSGIGTYKTPGTDLNGNPQIAAKGFTIDFNHHTYSVDKPAVGSKTYETQGFHLEWKGSIDTTPNITLKNGTLDVAQNHDPNLKLLIQNYCNLTLDNMTVDGTNLTKGWASNGVPYTYVTSNCNGTVNIKDTTIISGNPAYDVAFDVDGARHSYGPVHLTIDGNSRICGKFEVSAQEGNSLTINSGYFTSNPSDYLATGKGLVDSDLANYYKVGNSNVTVDTEVKAGDASVTIPTDSTITADDVKNAAQSQATQESLTKAASGLTSNESIVGTANDAKNALGDKVEESQTVTVVVQPYLNVEVKELPTSSNDQTMSVNISALYNVIATTDPDNISDSNSVTMKEAQHMSVSTPVTIKLALPNGFAQANDKLSIKHTKESGSVEYYTGIVSVESDKTYVTFTTNGFSPFVIYAASANVASIGDDVYPSLQAAVDAAQDNDVITLLKDTNENITVSKAVKFTLANKDKLTGTISAGSRYSMTTTEVRDGTQYTFTYVGGGSSSSGTTTTYNVNVNAATNGTVAADKKTAAKGATVTVTATASSGYVVDAVKVVDKDGKDVAVTVKDGKYVFTMPGSAVTVTGTFKAETPAPSGLPFVDVKSGDWFYGAVKYAYENGLMTGTSATTFAPNGTMNRAMIVTVLYRLEKSPAVTAASKFTDVPAGQWYSDAVAWAAANKIVNGYSETSFGPMNAVTREQLAAILFRYEQYKGLENVTLEENLNRFPDHDKVSGYAVPAMQWAVGQKIINGNADGTLDPTGTATRAQVAQILTNLLNQ